MKNDLDANMTDHEYDGIRELDNQLPEWWLVIFAGTVIFAFIYWIHYEVAGGPTTRQELALALEESAKLRPAGPSFDEDKLMALFTEDAVGRGQASYDSKCAVCHGPEGGGGIGPNLTDKFWIHGKATRADIFNVIAEGAPTKGMPAWREVLKEDELVSVSAFVYAMRNANVKGGKPAQGEEVP